MDDFETVTDVGEFDRTDEGCVYDAFDPWHTLCLTHCLHDGVEDASNCIHATPTLSQED